MDQWKYGQCVKTGLRHRRYGADCQDFVFAAEDENCIAVALCDGLGSLPASGYAAKYTSIAVCRILQQCATYDFRRFASDKSGLLKDLLERVNAALAKRFAEMHIDRKLADSTLAFVFVSKTFGFCYAACLGDSAVCLIKKSGCECLTESNAHSESTASVDMKNPWMYAAQAIVDLEDGDFLGAVLTSDGLDGEIYTKDSSLVFKATEYYFNAMLAADAEGALDERLTAIQTEYGDYYDDDISVAVLSRAEKRMKFPDDPTWLCRCGARNDLTETFCAHCGSDFMNVYHKINFNKYGGRAMFFRYMNRHPDLEKKVIGLHEIERRVTHTPPPAPKTEQRYAQRLHTIHAVQPESQPAANNSPPVAGQPPAQLIPTIKTAEPLTGEEPDPAHFENVLAAGQEQRRQKRMLIAAAGAAAGEAAAGGVAAAVIHRSSHKKPDNDD